MSLTDDWGFATLDAGFGVWVGEGDEDVDPPVAIFREEQWARDFSEYLLKRAAEQDEADGIGTHASLPIMDVRNVQVPFWNNGIDEPSGVPPATYDEADNLDTIGRLEGENDRLREALQELLALDPGKPVPNTFLAGVRAALGRET